MRRTPLSLTTARSARRSHPQPPCTARPTNASCNPHRIKNHLTRPFSSLPAPIDDGNRSITPIDFATSSTVTGEESQILEVRLREGEMLRAESGAMLYMTEGVQMETSMGNLSGQTSGVQTALTRLMTGQNLMVSDFTYTPDNSETNNKFGTVGLGTDFPAKILKFSLSDYPESKLICQKGAYLAGSHSVLMEMAFTKSFTSGFFGGEGFVLQSLRSGDETNDETVFLKAYGAVVKRDLKEGETLRISSGCLVAMTSTVDFDVTTLPGFKNVLFGGEGLFVTTLTGPGTVWLQGMPVDRMVSEIARRVPSGGGIGLGIPIFGGGGGDGGGDAAAAAAGDEMAAGAEGVESGVPVTDAAVEADRNATIASSGMMDSTSDPESAESLFGDAAYQQPNATDPGVDAATSETDTFSSSLNNDPFAESQMNTPEFEEPTMSEPQFQEPTMSEPQFEDDGTTFSKESSSFDESEATPASPDDEGPSLFSQLWDFFTDDE